MNFVWVVKAGAQKVGFGEGWVEYGNQIIIADWTKMGKSYNVRPPRYKLV